MGWKWAELVGRARTDQEFQAQLLLAKRIMKNETAKPFPPETVNSTKRSTISMSRSYDFLTAADLEAKFGRRVNLDALGLPVIEIHDEFQKLQRGIIVNTNKPRELTITNSTELATETGLMLPAAQLREGQGIEIMRSHEARAPVAKNMVAVTTAELQESFDKLVSAQVVATDMGAPPAPLQMAAQPGKAEPPQEEYEEDEEVKAARRLAAGGRDEQVKSRKGKGAGGKGGKAGGRGNKRSQPAPSLTEGRDPKGPRTTATPLSAVVIKKEEPQSSGDERSRSPARKSTSGRSSAVSAATAEDQAQKCREAKDKLSVHRALSGLKIKNDLYQARRCLGASGESPEAVELRARYDLVTKAGQLCPKSMSTLGSEQRNKLIVEVQELAKSDEIPDSFWASVLVHQCRDLRPGVCKDTSHWLRLVAVGAP